MEGACSIQSAVKGSSEPFWLPLCPMTSHVRGHSSVTRERGKGNDSKRYMRLQPTLGFVRNSTQLTTRG
eukprot:1564072-Amphidinium_carterae.2